MYIKDLNKMKSHNYKNPVLLDYWMTDTIKEKITINPTPQKVYKKLDNYVKINSNKSSSIHRNSNYKKQ